ncbi:Ankyrin repeat and KH domain-containing protein 1 [Hondaea fermentalgiana]|uniref:Ankyrin repeat and KH domain-containing protein 1 n=1 Tax=Hondaea fermentalgiana TaxID=2315210 RepID=A0A2R5GGK7_9STRA|nr:Ankyrin repeat and KH domain-containing protein 1 [Hondaea fermentalgiana]|eukprot:GBG30010.1 Ankyrin repeat and KH domain-containing protein 1 [Hondaea fermentalgiana]
MVSMRRLIKLGDLAGVQRVVQRKPDLLDASVSSGGHTPLMWAIHSASGGQTAIAEWLLGRGAKIDLQNNNGWTALMLACRYDQPDMAQMLIEQGAKMNLQENKGWTALMFACRYEQPDTALALIERGAKLDLQDTEGGTALMYACCYSQPDTAQAIIQRGAKVNLRDNEGWTALMLASRYDQPDTAQALIQRGAKLDLQLTDGWTALMLSCQQPEESHHTAEGLLRSLKLCYAAGADLSLETVDGNDALAWARWFDRPDAVAFLEFATASEVAQIPRDALRQPQDLVVAFYEENLLTVEDCLMLEDEDLKGMGVSSPSKRRAILQRLNPSFAPPPRSSLPRRASHHMSKVMRRLSGADQNDACLTTDWGSNGANHEFASSMENGRIRHAKRVTWFDKEGHDDDIDLQTSRGIGTSRKEQVLARGRAAFTQLEAAAPAGGRRILAVAGNDACDADSLVSAIGFAWWWSVSKSTADLGCHPVALANVPRNELKLRKDAELLFKKAGMSPEGLVFVDEAAQVLQTVSAETRASHVALGLTDHNALTARLGAIFGSDVNVMGIMDHHQDSGAHKDAAVRVVDEGCGSACTLVAERILDEGEALDVPDALVTMLLGVILLDTRDFDPDAKKFSDRDVRVHKALCDRFASIVPDREAQSVLFRELMDARGDVEGFSASDLLRLDFKSVALSQGTFAGSTIGFASIMDTAKGFVARAEDSGEGLDSALQSMMSDSELDALFCLCKPVKVPEGGGKMKSVVMRARKEGLLPPLCDALDRLPQGLPDELAANPLFGADVQDIVNQGFGLVADEPLRESAGLPAEGLAAVKHLRRAITRKTLMPTVISMLEQI